MAKEKIFQALLKKGNNVGSDFYLKHSLTNFDKRIDFDYMKLYQLA